jgi:O-antigen ligase
MVVLGVAVNYAAIYCQNEEKKRQLADLVFFSSIIPLAYGAFQFLFHQGMLIEDFLRLNSTFKHPNVFAEYLFIMFFAGMYLLNDPLLTKKKRRVVYFLLAMTVFELVHTFTRNVWGAFAMSGVLYVMLDHRFRTKIKYLFMGLLGLAASWGFLSARFNDLFLHRSDGYKNSLEWRLSLWAGIFENLKGHPIIGNGWGVFASDVGVMAHNDYLRLAYEIGFAGLAAYCILFLVTIAFAFKGLWAVQKTEAARYKIAICLVFGLVVMGLADNLARSTVILFYFWTLLVVLLTDPGAKNNAHSGR